MFCPQDITTGDDGVVSITAPILKSSAEKMNRHGMFLMDYGLVMHAQYSFVCVARLFNSLTSSMNYSCVYVIVLVIIHMHEA